MYVVPGIVGSATVEHLKANFDPCRPETRAKARIGLFRPGTQILLMRVFTPYLTRDRQAAAVTMRRFEPELH